MGLRRCYITGCQFGPVLPIFNDVPFKGNRSTRQTRRRRRTRSSDCASSAGIFRQTTCWPTRSACATLSPARNTPDKPIPALTPSKTRAVTVTGKTGKGNLRGIIGEGGKVLMNLNRSEMRTSVKEIADALQAPLPKLNVKGEVEIPKGDEEALKRWKIQKELMDLLEVISYLFWFNVGIAWCAWCATRKPSTSW